MKNSMKLTDMEIIKFHKAGESLNQIRKRGVSLPRVKRVIRDEKLYEVLTDE